MLKKLFKGGQVTDLLKTVAPSVATALGGPLAGVAAQAITGKLDDTPVADLGRVEALLSGAGPEDMVKLKELELEFQAQMEAAGIDLARIDAEDRDSARQRQVQMKDHTPSVLGVIILTGFFGILAYILRFGLPDVGGEVLLIMIGALGAMTTQVGNFFFGSSSGSKSKDAMIADLKRGRT